MEEKLFHLVEKGTSAVMVVQEAARQLAEAGFEELDFGTGWGLTENGRYYVKHHDTTLFAFTIGTRAEFRNGIRIGAAHTDFPCLRIKPNPDISAGGYGQVNVEVYGGAILNTWLDRPLSISGRIAVQSGDVMHPKMHYFSPERPLLVIPNLAIHMNREVNKGVELNKQTDMLPILGLLDETVKEQKLLMEFLAKELQVEPEQILDFELWVYCAETKQGAGSLLLLTLLEKINDSMRKTEEQTRQSLYNAFFLSVDVAHGLHPNQMGKMDLTNKPALGRGLCIKEAGSQSYATDCEAVAAVEQICRKYKIPYQKFVNRSDLAGGGTLGSIASSILPVRTVDVGVPVLAMHSAVETMGRADMDGLTKLMTAYFSDLD